MRHFFKRFLYGFIILLVLLSVIGCSDNGSESPVVDSPDNEEPIDEDPVDEDLVDDSLTEEMEELLFTMSYEFTRSTNGNINNEGYVISVLNERIHYVSSGSSVYRYDVDNQSFSSLFTLTGSGHAKYLSKMGSLLYYVNSSDLHLYVYDIETTNHSKVSDYEFIRLVPSDTRLFANYYSDQTYEGNPYPSWGFYDKNNEWFYTTNNHAMFPNMYYSWVFFKDNLSLEIDIRATNGAGSTLVNLADFNVTDVEELLILYRDQNYASHLAMVAIKNNQKGIYVYRSGDHSFTEVISGPMISNINYAHGHIYYKDNNAYYRIDESTLNDPEKVLDFLHPTQNVLIIDHYIYYHNDSDNTLIQVHPVTLEQSVAGQ